MPAALFRRIVRTASAVALIAVPLAFPASSPASSAEVGGGRTARLVGTWERITPTALATWGADRIVPPHFFGDRASTGAAISATEIQLVGTLVPNLRARQLWQLYPIDDAPGPYFATSPNGKVGVVVFDADTMRALATLELPMLRRNKENEHSSGDWIHAADGERMFFVANGLNEVVEVDARTFRVRSFPLAEPFTIATRPVFDLVGLTFDPGAEPDRTDDSLIAYAGTLGSGAAVATAIVKIPLDGTRTTTRVIRACRGGPTVNMSTQGRNLGVPVVLTAKRVLLACHRSEYTVVAIALDRVHAFDPESAETEIAGPVSAMVVMADPTSERLFVVTNAGEIWVFDGRVGSFVGVIATSASADPASGYGIDDETGRLYFQSPQYGFGVVEGRFFPVPQATVVPGTVDRGRERIISDARTRRVYVLPGEINTAAAAYRIYDPGPAPAPPTPPDPDRNTADVDEAPGKTESRFFASGSGFGVRAMAVKGLSTVPPMVGIGVQTTAQVINDFVNSKCGYTDRELFAGHVAKAEYDTGSTAAAAHAVEVDERTKVDLGQVSRCDVTVRDHSGTERFGGIFATAPPTAAVTGPGWGYEGASCTSSTGGSAQTEVGKQQNGRPSLGPSTATCPLPGGSLTASASAQLTGAVTVGRAYTDVRVERTSRGIESVVTSTADDISVGDGLLRIGQVRAEARSAANGRPTRGAMSTHAVRMAQVSVNGEELCGATCDVGFVVERLRTLSLGRVEFRAVSGRDEALLLGTPKGAQTAVQKSPYRRASDTALFGDARAEVPAFEIIVYNDNTEFGRARQVYQFAGVATAANYNIVPLPSFADLLDGDNEGPARPDGLSIDTPSTEQGGYTDASLATTSTAFERSGGGGLVAAIRRAVRAVGEGLALIVTDPRRAFLVLTAWAVIVAPAALSRRRRLLLGARS